MKPELTKRIGLDASFVRASVRDQIIVLQYVPSELQLADFFTKAQIGRASCRERVSSPV